MFRTIDANKRMLLALVVMAAIGANFWLGSRYPNLNEKAYMAGEMQLDALGFDVVIEVAKDDPVHFKVFATTVNWIKTNKTGMIFGIMMAAGLMTIMSLFKKRSFVGSFANTAMGALIGTPLGVCVNCAAPIARGMHAAGARLETTLAMMLSSPTLNVIVLTMLFALFPWYMAAIKIAVTLGFILVCIPLLSRHVFRNEVMATSDSRIVRQTENPFQWSMYEEDAPAAGESWLASVRWVAITYLRHLWYIVRTTVPLMLLAGFLGAVVISVMPWNSLSTLVPDGSPLVVLAFLFVVAAIGIFLPCPITFDVIAVSVLLSAGMPASYAMAMLFTLGIFSIYSFSIVWTAISRKVAIVLTASLVVAGVAAGYAAGFGEAYEKRNLEDLVLSVLRGMPPAERAPRGDPGLPAAGILASLDAGRLQAAHHAIETPTGIAVSRLPWVAAREDGPRGPGFVRHDGSVFGINAVTAFTALRVITPINMGRGIAAGDVHGDGWPDILLAEDRTVGGVTLYANRDGKRFEAQRLDIPELDDKYVIVAALVDIDDDGWLDMFLSTYMDGNFIVLNRNGAFPPENLIRVANPKDASTFAASFGDIDSDGDLDGVVGNWSVGGSRQMSDTSKNLLLLNRNGQFQAEPLDELVGETLSALISDFNDDGIQDLFIGNDFSLPDYFYLGTGNGSLRQIRKSDRIVPHTTTTTMTVHVADIDNDLVPEMYIGEISRGVGVKFHDYMRDADVLCEDHTDSGAKQACATATADYLAVAGSLRRRNVSLCLDIANTGARAECIAVNVLWSLLRDQRRNGPIDPARCDVLPAYERIFRHMCQELTKPPAEPAPALLEQTIAQIDKHNVLLVRNTDGSFADEAIERGLELGGWSWNARFADVDNDGWKDVYIANGAFLSDKRETNLFYQNRGDGRFQERTGPFGLEDFQVVTSYTYVDFDNDGDLDIISVPVDGNVRVFENTAAGNNSVAFELRDYDGNRFGIGARIVIRHRGGARQQMSEIQSGGGYLSFDPYIAYFGIGKDTQVDEVEVRWPAGGTTKIRGPFPAGARYTISREAGSTVPRRSSP